MPAPATLPENSCRLALACAALSVFLVLALGVPRLNGVAGYDADFALRLIAGMGDAVRRGELPPRWLPGGNDGFGAPVFLFYGPLAFLPPALLSQPFHVPAQSLLGLTLVLSQLAQLAGTVRWLRLHVSRRTATTAAALATLLPFTLVETVCRVAPAELAVAALFPWALLVVDTEGIPPLRRTARLALLIAAIAAAHPLHLGLSVAALLLYATLAHGLRGATLVLASATAGGLAAALTLSPALLDRGLITQSAWWDAWGLSLDRNILFSPGTIRLFRYGWFERASLSTTWLAIAFLCRALFGLRRSDPSRIRTPLVILCVVLFATSWPSLPLWSALPALRIVQFPWRLFVEAGPFAALGIARLIDAGGLGRTGAALACATSLAFLSVPILGAIGQGSDRLPRYATGPRPENGPWRDCADAPEYLPPGAASLGYRFCVGAPIPMDDPRRTPVLPTGVTATRLPDGLFRLDGTLRHPAAVHLPVLSFPFFAMSDPRDTVARDPRTALVRIDLPAGPVHAELRRIPTAPERWGLAISAAMLPLLLGLSLRARPSVPLRTRSDPRSRVPVPRPPRAPGPDGPDRPAAAASGP